MKHLKNRNLFLEASVNDIAERIAYSDFVKMLEHIQDILSSYTDDNELNLIIVPVMKNHRAVRIKEGESIKDQLEKITFGKLESADRVEVKINSVRKINCGILGEITKRLNIEYEDHFLYSCESYWIYSWPGFKIMN